MKARHVFPVTLLALAACTVGPNYEPPVAHPPPSWAAQAVSVATTGGDNAALSQWWRNFNDPLLNRLVRDAAAANHDLKIAAARLREARAARLATGSLFWPQVNAQGEYARARLSESGQLGGVLRRAGAQPDNDLFNVGLDASWEIDVFGGVRRSVEGAEAELAAAEEARRDVLVTLLAEVAGNYIELRGAQKRLSVLT